MTPTARQHRITQELLRFEDAQERLTFVQDRVRRTPPIPPDLRTDDHRIQGCATPVWLNAAEKNGRLELQVDSLSGLVRGLASLITEVYSGATAAEILAFNCTILTEAKLKKRITPTRLHGLAQLQAAIHALARAYTEKTQL